MPAGREQSWVLTVATAAGSGVKVGTSMIVGRRGQ
jgi:hypothetical protein